MQRPFLSVVIPTYNSGSLIGQTIEACLAQEYPGGKIEIIVVDDDSTDGTKEIAARYPVKYIRQRRSGPAAARNIGYRSANGDLIFFTDADCVPAGDCLTIMTEDLYKKNVAAVTGTYGLKNKKGIVARCIHEEIIFRHSRMPDYPNSFATYNLLIRKDILKELGGFDESYLTSSAEDSELSYRLMRKGFRVYFEKKAIVYHLHEDNLRRYLKKQFTRAFWAMKLYRTHPDSALKDYYIHWKDFAELPLAVLVLVSLALAWLKPFNAVLVMSLLIYALIETIIPFMIYFKKRCVAIFFLCPIMAIRGFIRIFGGAAGLLKWF